MVLEAANGCGEVIAGDIWKFRSMLGRLSHTAVPLVGTLHPGTFQEASPTGSR